MNLQSIRRCASVRAGLFGLVATVLAFPAGAIQTTYTGSLSGAAEAPPNGSAGIGATLVTVDSILRSLRVQVTFSGLVADLNGAPSGVTAAHIHCCTTVPGTGTAGVATVTPTFTGFPSGVRAGTYDQTFDMNLAASWNPAFIIGHGGTTTSAFNDLLAGLNLGESYLNIHSTAFPAGEVRAFLVTAVPEPETYALMLAGLGALAMAARRKRA